MINISTKALPTQRYLFSGVRRKDEEKEGEGGDKHTGQDDVEAVVQRATADVNGEGHVNVKLWAAVVL